METTSIFDFISWLRNSVGDIDVIKSFGVKLAADEFDSLVYHGKLL